MSRLAFVHAHYITDSYTYCTIAAVFVVILWPYVPVVVGSSEVSGGCED